MGAVPMGFVSVPMTSGIVEHIFAIWAYKAGYLTAIGSRKWGVDPQESVFVVKYAEIISLKNSTTFRAKRGAEQLYPILYSRGIGILAQKVNKIIRYYYFFG